MRRLIKFLLFFCVFIFLSNSAGAQVLQNFDIVGHYFVDGDTITGLCMQDHYLYITENYDSLRIFDLSLADTLEQIGVCAAPYIDNLFINGDILVGVAFNHWNSFSIFDVSSPYSPQMIFSLLYGFLIIPNVDFQGNFIYLPTVCDLCTPGLYVYDITAPSNPILADHLPYGEGFDIDLYRDFAYETTFSYTEIAVIDISNPYSVQLANIIHEHGGGVKVYGNHLFIGGPIWYGSDPVRVYSLQNPGAPFLKYEIPTSFGNTIRIEIVNGYLFALNWLSGLIMFDIGGFSAPESLGFVDLPADTNFVLPQIAIKDSIIYFSNLEYGLYKLAYTGGEMVNTGDANRDGDVNGLDVVYLVNYFKGLGPAPPDPQERGDTNGDCTFNGLDVIYLVGYLRGGPEPIRGFCYEPPPD
ncbi:MAG: hypothetical protein JSW64_13235 [Candidatus Zixiibacteriota bacterium]|nr:MAG: hypothetical protein JSW64_13235 [candidate division Zixibacteria bacterium]